MAIYTLKNNEIEITVHSLGAELKSLKDISADREYMWLADGKYWARTSPILFPIVGCYRNGESYYNGEIYKMSQHGFARDLEFMLTEQTEEEIWFCLTDKEENWEAYPFAFSLEIGYRLEGRSVKVMWRVTNPADQTMYFSIGGHPGFMAPQRSDEKTTCYVKFDNLEKITCRQIADGLATEEVIEIPVPGGILAVTEEVFANDALVIEGNQTQKVQLLDEKKEAFITVEFEAPLFGVWTPPGKNAPFICIEPWYGRCDKVNFTGSIEQREWGNMLEAGEVFEAEYLIKV